MQVGIAVEYWLKSLEHLEVESSGIREPSVSQVGLVAALAGGRPGNK